MAGDAAVNVGPARRALKTGGARMGVHPHSGGARARASGSHRRG